MDSRNIAYVNRKALKSNLEQLTAQALKTYDKLHGSVVMVKANAYGHGIVGTSQVFDAHRDVLAFGVAALDEAIQLRKAKIQKPIWVFSDCSPWDEEHIAACEKYHLIPVLSSLEDLKKFSKIKSNLDFQIKFNTGMNRLGISISDLAQVKNQLKNIKKQFGVLSHLASSSLPNSKLTQEQVSRFKHVVQELSCFNPKYIHCANTDGVLTDEHLKLSRFCNVIRPGIGLYGYSSDKKIKLKPALEWKVKVLSSRVLQKGEHVGYLGTYYCRQQKTPQSVLAVGYADGFFRALSNQEIFVQSKKTMVLGRVSMDLCSIKLGLKQGSWVTILGKDTNQGEVFAKSAGTIIYEVLTSISARVPRIYK